MKNNMNMLQGKKTVSFDVFDTLITRKTATPKGIFKIMQEVLKSNNKYTNLPEFIKDNFYTLRVQSEAYLRKTKVTKEIQDITFQEIYDVIGYNNGLSKAQIAQLKELEIEIENKNICGIEENIEKLKKYMQEGYNVILISDMYLPANEIRRLLTKVDKVFFSIPLFISSEYRKTKGTGELYEVVKEKNCLNKNLWTHIGDNPYGDIAAADRFGISVQKYDMPAIKDYEKKILEKNNGAYVQLSIGTSRILRLRNKTSSQYDLGACYGGPLFYDYVSWVINQSIQRGFNRLYFVARDGYILKNMADIIIKKNNYNIQTKYIYGSRDAWRLASILSDKEDISQTIFNSVEINSIEDLAGAIHLDKDTLQGVCKNIKITNTQEAELFLKKHKKIRNMVLEKALSERENVAKYLKQEIDFSDNNFCFVEFKGTGKTQDCLNKIIRTFYDKDISSFYMMLDRNQFLQNSSKFVYIPNKDFSHHIIEIFLRAPHGQTLGYEDKNGKTEPILEDKEHIAYIKWGYEKYIQGIKDYTETFLPTLKQLGPKSATVMYEHYFDYLMKSPDWEFASLVGSIPYTNGTKVKKVNEAAPVLRKCDVNDVKKPTRATSSYNGRLFSLSLARTKNPITGEIVYKKETPDVSVILPVYNVKCYLEQCLDSLLSQTLKDIEIICVDDGSTDGSLDILKKYQNKDERIQVIEQINSGAGSARNTGLKIASGKYLSFLDSDDFFEPNMLETLFNCAQNDDLDIVCCDINLYDNVTKKISRPAWILKQNELPNKKIFNYKDISDSIFSFSHTAAWNKLFKRSFVEKEKLEFQTLPNTNDFYFVCAALVTASRISACNQRLLYYRTNNKLSLSNTKARSLNPENGYMAIKKLSEKLKEIKIYEVVEQSLIDRLLSIYYYNSHLGDDAAKNYIYDRFKKQWINEFKLNEKNKKYFKREVYYEMLQEIEHLKITKEVGDEPKISVLVPIYNVKQYLAECIDSIIMQTLTNIEIILLDDGSTDGSAEICDEYAQKDQRIKVIHKPNSGYGATMNIGLDNARGKYVGIVESDDYIRPEMYEEQYKLAEKEYLDFLKADFRIFVGDKDFRTFTYRPMSYNKSYYNRILKPRDNTDVFNTYNTIWSGIYKREFLIKNNIRFNETPGASYQDNGFYFQTYSLADRMWIMDKDFYQLRRDNPNSSIKSKAKVFCMCDEYHFIENFLKQHANLKEKLYKIFLFKKYQNYMFTFERIAFEFKLMFLKRMSEEFKDVYLHGCISAPEFSVDHINVVRKIVKNYQKYYSEYLEKIQRTHRQELQNWYKRATGKYLNLDNPCTFNEKIQWLKLYDSTPIKTRLADKYLVRDWIKEKIGEQYLIPLLGVYDKFEDIDFAKLPNQFVIKCNHGSGMNIIVKDKTKLNLLEAKEKLDKWMSENFAFKFECELHYRNIQPKIIIEKYMENKESQNLYNYKFWCFNGEVKYMQFRDDFSANLKMVFYDLNWKRQPFYYDHPLYDKKLEKPDNFQEMINLAKKLCQGFAFVCVDLYRLDNGNVYFGEMTFTRSSGSAHWNDEKYNRILGNMIKLPKLAYNIDTGEYYKLPKKSRIEPWLQLPYNLCQKAYLMYKEEILLKKQIQKQLTSSRIDIKNFGNANNAVETTTLAKISAPVWFANAQGQGQVVESNKKIQSMTIKAIQDGKLILSFKGQDKRYNGTRFPVWVDYKSIKIDGKEILSVPVATWHDKPFRCEMPVKDGQVVKVEVVQQYHQYSKGELKDVILKLNPNSDYIRENIKKFSKKIHRKITEEKNKQKSLFAKTEKIVWENIKGGLVSFSLTHNLAPVTDLMRQNQAQTLKLLQKIQAENASLENRNKELRKEIEVLKKDFNTQLSNLQKQQDERFKQLLAIKDELFIEVQGVAAEIQSVRQPQISEKKLEHEI